MSVTVTNIKQFPAPFVDAINFSDFSPTGTVTLSRLVDAPQIAYLRKRNDLEEDISEKAWTLISKALLQVIENGDDNHRHRRAFSTVIQALVQIQNEKNDAEETDMIDARAIQEHNKALGEILNALDVISKEHYPADKDRYMIRQSYGVSFEESYTCFKGTDKEFSGKEQQTVFETIPLYDKQEQVLHFMKICSTWHATKPDMRNSWVREANIQAYILEKNGFPVKSITATMIFKNWEMGKIGVQKDYPTSQMQSMQLPIHKIEDTEKLIKVQLRRHLRASNGDVPECLPNERWADADSWIVMRPGAKKPLKRCQSEQEALQWLGANRVKAVDGYIEKEPGKSKRCESYCPVREVCPQWKKQREKLLQSEPVTGTD